MTSQERIEIWENDLIKNLREFASIGQTIKNLQEAIQTEKILISGIEDKFCKWVYQEDTNFFKTSCGKGWTFPEGTLEDNNCFYCPVCGKEIKMKGNK